MKSRKKSRRIDSYEKPKTVKKFVRFPYKRVRIDWIDIITEGGWGTDKEFKDMMASPTGFDPKHTVTQKGRHVRKGDYYEQFDRIEHQMSLRAKKALKTNPRAKYFDVIEVLESVPSYKRLMNIIAAKEGDFSPNMRRLKLIPEYIANQHGVYF